MASSSSQKVLCVTCSKVTGLFTCRGCQQNFCTRHVAEHRQELGKQMDEITVDHDHFRQTLIEQSADVRMHPLLIEINEWEQQSIERIRQIAHDARQQLGETLIARQKTLSENLTKIGNELNKAREEDNYFETDFVEWIAKIDRLKKEANELPNVRLPRFDNDILPVVPNVHENISLKEIFQQSTGEAAIEDNGEVIVKNTRISHAAARGRGEFNFGQHRFRFRIERYFKSGWIQIGIVSKTIPIQANSYQTPSFYGWGASNQVYLNGRNHQGYNGYTTDIQTNDEIELTVDCDKQTIILTNERTRSTYGLVVDLQHCPFPWQLSIGLYYSLDRIRILHT
ncbi:unnamed protein product [Adineta ricciae]|uniref:B30.2/SPRY domain-containing protein n=1 Tax=Adineta ricciae TaxID=249248 RepID=A0A816FHL2_ADIRI|nr:unnamed protein product [Adineta ricciae]